MRTDSHPAFAWIRNLAAPVALVAVAAALVAPAAPARRVDRTADVDPVVVTLARGASRHVATPAATPSFAERTAPADGLALLAPPGR